MGNNLLSILREKKFLNTNYVGKTRLLDNTKYSDLFLRTAM